MLGKLSLWVICWIIHKIRRLIKLKNHYEIHGDETFIFLNRGLKAVISTSDLEMVKEFPNTWSANFNKRRGVNIVIGNAPWNGKETRERVLLHRWIMNPCDNFVVDHINHDTLDNRRENLRILTNQENCQNRKGANQQSKSGLRGLVETPWGTWNAHIKVNWKRINIGNFKTKEEAQLAVIEARKKYMPYSIEKSI